MPRIYEKVEILLYLESSELLAVWKVRITAVPGVIRCHGCMER
jgi:hypothetical protein